MQLFIAVYCAEQYMYYILNIHLLTRLLIFHGTHTKCTMNLYTDFYSVLKAQYTMPSHGLNNVPIAMFFATHFYFQSYHLFSNALLRKDVTTYKKEGFRQAVLYIAVVVVFSYFTAFMETLTISSFPYYSFEDRAMAYMVGSAFYGIYFFLVSFPGFFVLDDDTLINHHHRK